MGFFESLAAIIAALAWPALVFYMAISFRDEISSFTERVVSFKFPGGELVAAQKAFIKNATKPKMGAEVIFENEGPAHSYKLYANGQIVQKIKYHVRANDTVVQITFPIAFPFEITSILPIGTAALNVVELTNTGCKIQFERTQTDREISLIVSGI